MNLNLKSNHKSSIFTDDGKSDDTISEIRTNENNVHNSDVFSLFSQDISNDEDLEGKQHINVSDESMEIEEESIK